MNSREDGQITCLVPVFECAERLKHHLGIIQGLQGICADILWVITQGQDESEAVVRSAIRAGIGRHMEVPRGLYQAWNSGVACVTTEFVYVSTVGEAISPQGLTVLRDSLQRTGADVCFTPPILPKERKSRNQLHSWPVFRFQRELRATEGKILNPWTVAKLQALAGIHGLLGSCASCLFRTAFLQTHPFPSNLHHYGDSGWVYQNYARAKMVFLHSPVASFTVHGPSGRLVNPRDLDKLRSGIVRTLRLLPKGLPAARALQRMSACTRYLDLHRGPRPSRFWWLQRNWLAVRIQRQQQANLFQKRMNYLSAAIESSASGKKAFEDDDLMRH